MPEEIEAVSDTSVLSMSFGPTSALIRCAASGQPKKRAKTRPAVKISAHLAEEFSASNRLKPHVDICQFNDFNALTMGATDCVGIIKSDFNQLAKFMRVTGPIHRDLRTSSCQMHPEHTA